MAQEIQDLANKLEASGYAGAAEEWRLLAQAQLAAGEIPQSLQASSEVARRDEFSQKLFSCRVGAFISPELLRRGMNQESNQERFGQYRLVLKDIQENAQDSIYHLCLSMDLNNHLFRYGVRKISQLDFDVIMSRKQKQVGPKTIQQISLAYEEFLALQQN